MNNTNLDNFPQIVGITGKKFHGKDTLGLILENNYGYIRVAFADTLKDACMVMFDLTHEQVYGNNKETVDDFWKTTPRTILQYVGTDLCRNQLSTIMPHINDNIWVDVVKRKIINKQKKDPAAKFVITDVRFQNEIDFIKSIGGQIIRIQRQSMQHEDSHSSEANIDLFEVHHEIENDKDVDHIHTSFVNLFR